MAKRFKLRISRVIPSFQSCRSKDPSILTDNPVRPFLRQSTVVTPPPTTKQLHRSSFKSHVSSAFIGCGFGSKSDDSHSSDLDFQWQEDDQWHVVAKIYDNSPRRKIYNSSVSGEDSDEEGIFPLPLPLPLSVPKKRRGKKTRAKLRHHSTTSSSETTCGFDEREEEGETDTLVSSSRSFSTDSSTDFNPQLETIRETSMIPRRQKKKTKKRTKRATANGGPGAGGMMCRSSTECSSPARLSVFTKLIPSCKVEGKVKESFAVVKKSEDPYEDFKRSMMEMIVEKQMFEERDLEQLLQCFLSLNSRYHHGVIVEAFVEIWNTMFRIPRISSDYSRGSLNS